MVVTNFQSYLSPSASSELAAERRFGWGCGRFDDEDDPVADGAMTLSRGFVGSLRSELLFAAIGDRGAQPPPYVVVAYHPGFARDRIAHWTQSGRSRRHVGRTPAFGEVADVVVVPEISWMDLKSIPIPRENPVLDDRQPFIVMDRSLHLVVVIGPKPSLHCPGSRRLKSDRYR
jgi:hypothetical protein